jgi:hypothetical protein
MENRNSGDSPAVSILSYFSRYVHRTVGEEVIIPTIMKPMCNNTYMDQGPIPDPPVAQILRAPAACILAILRKPVR